MTAVERVLTRLERVKRSGSGWTARCPAHEDRNPSLKVDEGENGAPLIFCHAGCENDAILAALGLSWPELLSENGAAPREWTPHGDAVAVYDYVDEDGRLLFQVCRTADKQFPQRRPDPTAKHGWRWNLTGVRRVLYRLPELVRAIEAGETVYVCEGEKDVEAVRRAGAAATCNPGGVKKWRDEYTEFLAGATDVVVVADRDEEGHQHAAHVAAALTGRVGSVRIVEAAAGKDASDHLAAGKTLAELAAVELPLACHTNGNSAQRARTPKEQATASQLVRSITIVPLDEFADFEEPGARALVGTGSEALVPEGGDVMLYGDGGAGKTTLAIDLACHLAAGDPWLGMPVARPVRVLLVENEGPRPLFRSKLRRKRDGWTGSPLEDRVHVYEDPWARFTFAEPAWRAALAEKTRELEVDVVVVGPLTRVGMDEAGTLQEVAAFMALVAEVRRLAGRHITFVLVHHENKGGQVSGAWEGSGDTLLHVQGQGHGRTRLYVQKARWASAQHATSLQLRWTDGEGFEVEDKPEIDDEALAEQLFAFINENPGTTWTKVETATPGVNKERRRDVRDGLFAAERIVNIVKDDGIEVALDHCPERRQSRLYRADDPAISHLRPDPGAVAAQSAPARGAGGLAASAPCAPPLRGAGVGAAAAHPEILDEPAPAELGWR